MWFRKIKNKKKQYILIATIVMLSTAILSGCLAFVIGINVSSKEFLEKCTDMYTYINKGKPSDDFEKLAKEDDRISIENREESFGIKMPIKEKGKRVNPFYVSITAVENYKDTKLCMSIYKGKDKKAPGDDEVWVDAVSADDRDLDIGDTIEIGDRKLKISAIYRNALRLSSLYGASTLYCNANTLHKLNGKLNPQYLYCIKCDGLKEEERIPYLTKHVKDGIENVGLAQTKGSLNANTQLMSVLIGGMGALAAIIIFIAAVIVISFVIKNCINEEYRAIGIHKALGDTNRTIKSFYLKSYLFVGAIGTLIGAFLGIPLADALQVNFLKYMQDSSISGEMILTSIGCGVVLFVILFLCLATILRRISKITPVEAIRMGMTSSKKKIHKSLFRNAKTSGVMALNEIFKKRGNSIMMVLLLCISVYLSLFFIVMYDSCIKMNDYPNKWFSIPKSDVTITGEITDDLVKDVKNSKYVKRVYEMNLFQSMSLKLTDKGATKKAKSGIFTASTLNCNSWDDKTGITVEEGRYPKKKNEIMMGKNLINEIDYKVGDYINLEINGLQAKNFLITGTFTTMMNTGKEIAFLNEVFDYIGTEEANGYSEVLVSLKNAKDYSKFKKEIQDKHDGAVLDKVLPAIDSACDGVIAMVKPVALILVFIFILFSITNIFILLEMEQQNSRRQFGILKALGRTNGYLCRKMFWKVGILSVIAMIFGTVLNNTVSASVFKASVGVDGFILNMPLTMGMLAVLALIIIIITSMFCLPLRKILPKELMEE